MRIINLQQKKSRKPLMNEINRIHSVYLEIQAASYDSKQPRYRGILEPPCSIEIPDRIPLLLGRLPNDVLTICIMRWNYLLLVFHKYNSTILGQMHEDKTIQSYILTILVLIYFETSTYMKA